MHRQPWPYMDYMDSYTFTPTAAIATVNTGFVCFHRILKTLPNINRIIKLLLPQNSAAKIKYIYLTSSQNINSKHF